MSLRSMINDLRTHAEVADDEYQVKVRTGQFVELSARLRPALEDLPRIGVGVKEVMRLESVITPDRSQDAAQVVENLRALATELSNVTMDNSLDLARARVSAAVKHVNELRAFVAGAWKQHVSEPPPAINSDLIDALAEGGVDVERIRESLESARGRLLAVCSRALPEQGDVRKFRDAVEAIQRCGEQLGEVVDADIAEGIVGSQKPSGMPLRWFTPERLQKLTGLGIIDRFEVRLQ